MIRLNATTKVLQVVLGGAVSANQPQLVASWVDQNQQNDLTQGWQTETVANSTTDVTLVAAPPQNFVRNIDSVFIYNADTASATAIVKIDDGGTERILVRRTLLTLQTLAYEHGVGWYYMSVT